MKITMEVLSQNVSGSEEAASGIRRAVDFMTLFSGNTMQSFMELMHHIDEEGEANVHDSEMQLAFVRSEYLLGWYIQTLGYVDLEKDVLENWKSSQEDWSKYLLLRSLRRL